MSNLAIWIDREHAKIFEFSAEKMERRTIHAGQREHHSHKIDNLDHQRVEHKIFVEMVAQAKNAENLLIVGPGVAKYHFQNFLIEHHPSLAKKVLACESMDHPTDGQIAAMAQKFFHKTLAAVK